MGEPLANFHLFASVSGTDTMLVKIYIYIKDLSGGTPCKILVVIFKCAALVGFPKEAKSGLLDQFVLIIQNLKGQL